MKGSRIDKILQIVNKVRFQFIQAKSDSHIVHDSDLRKWALESNKEIQLENFKASKWWIRQFKIANSIVSRKITKFVSIKFSKQQKDIEANAKCFVENIQSKIHIYGIENVYNTDQSGFNKEIHSGRTLAIRGEKQVTATVQQISATKHSYTIQPMVSASGKLASPMLVVLQEKDGIFGPIVQETMFRAENIFQLPSVSGKVGKEHIITWFEQVYFPNVNDKTLLIVDSLSHYKDIQAITSVKPMNKEFELSTIPPNTTSIIQPLDVYGFRPWKNFVRKFSDQAILHNYEVNLHQRDNIIKIQSLTHNQFSSPRFINLFKYSWHKSGYIEERPQHFINPVEFCFKLNNINCNFCDNFTFVNCGWCKAPLCFNHFYICYHFCNNYIP